jgi:hypothetical protein
MTQAGEGSASTGAKYLGIMNQFSLSSPSHRVSQLAALAAALITLGSVNSSE